MSNHPSSAIALAPLILPAHFHQEQHQRRRQHNEDTTPTTTNDRYTWHTPATTHPCPTKRLSPGLATRLLRLEEYKRRARAHRWAKQTEEDSIGRIPADQLVDLERRRWTRPPVRASMSAGGVRLNGTAHDTAKDESFGREESGVSDVSSIISISEKYAASDTEEDGCGSSVMWEEKEKFRMPDIGKTRLCLRTKEPFSPSPSPRPVAVVAGRRGSGGGSTPTTPGGCATMTGHSPSQSRRGSAENVSEGDYTNSSAARLSRAGSIYTLSRVSFTGQLSQLTSMRLPDAGTMAKRISSIPTSKEAAKELSDASEQIRMWVSQASTVLDGLNAEDDVEWAAAGGRDGIEEVDNAINRFDRLVQVYIMSIERLQTRDDAKELSAEELLACVKQMEDIIASWEKVKRTLGEVKAQVEIAMEWEELWNTVLGEIGQEMEGLNRLVFEMEEKRHEGAESLLSSKDSIDISELETIVEERPGRGEPINRNRFSLPPFSPSSPIQAPQAEVNRDDSSLLALFARMQPLRASLDFLPMRLSVFHGRANPVFPTACEDLDHRRDTLEAQWKKLESDAESLRRELGEDKWVLVFRNAGRQALKMCESVTRSFQKLRHAADVAEQQTDLPAFAKKIESYEAKKTHYGPALERVLAIIDRGVLDRLTVNGEILRLQSDMKRMWHGLQTDMRELDVRLEGIDMAVGREKQLRDSVSTVMSSEQRSVGGSSDMLDLDRDRGTPGTSPGSSVVGASASRKGSFHGSRTPTPLMHGKVRPMSRSQHNHSTATPESTGRLVSASSLPRRIPLGRASPSSSQHSSSSPVTTRLATPKQQQNQTLAPDRPRWISTAKPETKDFLPLSALEPSPYAKAPVTPRTNFLRATSKTAPRSVSSPQPPPPSQRPASAMMFTSPSDRRKSSLPVPSSHNNTPFSKSSPGPTPRSLLAPKSSSPALRRTAAAGGGNGRRSSMLPERLPFPPTLVVGDGVAEGGSEGDEADTESPAHRASRPSSSLAKMEKRGRRSSMLPLRARSRMEEGEGGGGGAGVEGEGGRLRPKWRG